MSALQNTPAITPEIVAEHGLTPDEYQTVLDIMGREPNMTELGIFFRHVVGALLLQVVAQMVENTPNRGSAGDPRSGRECGRRRYR